MKTNQIKLIRKQVSDKLRDLTPLTRKTKGVASWSRYIREALGMSLTQYAERLKLSVSTTSEAEKAELEGTLTLNKLKKMAEALDCELVYAFVPKQNLETLIAEQAKKKVLAEMERSETHMDLEDQRVSRDKSERLRELIEEKMYSKYLWEQD